MSSFHTLGDRKAGRYNPNLADELNQQALEEERRKKLHPEQTGEPTPGKTDEPTPEKTNENKPDTKSLIMFPFDCIEKSTYARAIQSLRQSYANGECDGQPFIKEAGKKIAIPLTFKQTIEARVNDYNSNHPSFKERLMLFNVCLSSCSGVAYKANSDKFKVIPVCKQLIEIPYDFSQEEMDINYKSLQGPELDRGKAEDGKPLTKSEVLEHPALLAAVEDNKKLLKAYADIVFAETRTNELMGFYLRSKSDKETLRTIKVHDLGNYSNTNGNGILCYYAHFVRLVSEADRE
jgi:hypothetical protein